MTRTIVFAMLQEQGHLYPSFKLARSLAARGWDVRYWAIPDFEATIRGKGFGYLAFLPELHPLGSTQREAGGLLAARRAISARFEAVSERLLAKDGAGAQLAALAPALVLVDVNLTLISLLVRKLGLPLLLLNTSLPQTKDHGVPPLRSGRRYKPSPLGNLGSELAWRKVLWTRRAAAQLAALGSMCPPYELARRHAQRFGCPPEALDCDTVYMPQLRDAGELVLCPQSFDFPRAPRAGRAYVASVELDREEPAFAWDRIDAGKPLVYVSMGSQLYRTQQVSKLLLSAASAFGARPWQVVMVLGKHVSPDALRDAAPNVIALPHAPQLALLRRARVMVTHGGLGSVKECVLLGVPMVVVPLAIDQSGNASRVGQHALGIERDLDTLDGPGLVAAVEHVLGDPAATRGLAAMRREFERTEQSELGVEIVERTIAGGAEP